jgi:hypothetical protein
MKTYKIAGLVLLTLLPIFTLFTFDHRYNAVEDKWCRQYPKFKELCDYPERHEKHYLLNTNYYRHLGSLVGRSEGTSPSFDSDIRSYLTTANSNDASYEDRALSGNAYYDAEEALGRFNLNLFITMIISTVVATAAFTLLCQELIKRMRARKKKPHKVKVS